MCTNVSLENNTPALLCLPAASALLLHCEWADLFVYSWSWTRTELCRFSCIMSQLSVLHQTVTTCGAPPPFFFSFFQDFMPHLISILLLLTAKKLTLLLPAANSVTFPGCALFPPSLCGLSRSPWKHESRKLQIHTFHALITLFIFFLLLFSTWPHHLTPSTQIYYSIIWPCSASV